MSKIVRFSATNYKRLKAVEIVPDPDGRLVTIAGRNAQGKSSVLDAISAALGGVNKKTTPRPIRDGEDSAEVVLETEDLIVERRFTPSGSTLVVRRPDGSRYPAPQQKLDDLLGKLSLDPMAFLQLDAKRQREALLELVDLPYDPAQLEANRSEIYAERTEIGRQRKAIGQVEVDEDLPTQETAAGDLIAQIQEAQERNRQTSEAQSTIAAADERIKALQAQLDAAIDHREQWVRYLGQLGDPVDIAPLQERLATIEDTNAAIRANNEARQSAALYNQLSESYERLSSEIDRLDQVKSDGLAAATMPIDGLGFNDSGVTYQGLPLGQASSAEQLRVSLAMAIALNPELRVIRIADGSLLDDENLAMIRDMAEQHDAQIWIEIVGDGDGSGVIIEDGEIKE